MIGKRMLSSLRQKFGQEAPASIQDTSFVTQLFSLPEPLLMRCLRHFAMGAAILILTAIMLLSEKQWEYGIGFLLALYIAYPGFAFVGQYYSRKITEHTMLCTMATKITPSQLSVIMLDKNNPEPIEDNLHKFRVGVTRKNIKLFKEDVVFHIFIHEDRPHEIIAWEAIGYRTSRWSEDAM